MIRLPRAVALSALFILAPALAENVPVRILALNDFHGHVQADRTVTVNGLKQPAGGAAWIASLVRRERAQRPNALLVEAGDMAGGSPPISALFQDEPTVEFLNLSGCDVGTLGNHELDEGMPEALRLWKGGVHRSSRYYPKPFPGAKFPIICSNLVDARSGRTFFPPYVVKKVSGVKIAFIGAVTEELPNAVAAKSMQGIRELKPAFAINRSVKELQKWGVHAFVVLVHEGGNQERGGALTGAIVDLVKALDKDVDVVVSAHSHQFTNARIGRVLVTQARWAGTSIARIDLTVDRGSDDIVSKSADILDVLHTNLPPDKAVEAMVAGYDKLAGPRINKVVGETAALAKQPGRDESGLGNLIADAQREAVGADIAFMNPGGIRADLPEGTVTWGQAYAVQPFGNQVVTLNLTGAQVRAVLEQQWRPDGNTMLPVSGITYTYDPAAEIGHRVTTITGPDGKPLDDAANYTVAMNSFLAGGGDGFTALKDIAAKPGPNDLDALLAYIAAHPRIAPSLGRAQPVSR
ncbi:MAG TPA: 5'-nucleotidase C-terminal domain-containing protein [Armatimonadota bacterium]|jgi:5'-nucleotidase